jgi:hypothetical protein
MSRESLPGRERGSSAGPPARTPRAARFLPSPPRPTVPSPTRPLHRQNIGVTNKFYVEFGFNENHFEGGSGANTFALHKYFGWKGLLLDGSHVNATINLHTEFLREDNIVALFEKYGVPEEPDFVSVDVDSADVLLLNSILSSHFKPRVLTVEYNCNFPLDATMSLTPTARWESDRAYGASLNAIRAVAERHGYVLVQVVPGLDAVLVRADLLCGGQPPPFSTWAPITNWTMHIKPVDLDRAAAKFMDSEVYFKTRDVAKAQAAGRAYLANHDYILGQPNPSNPQPLP